MKTYSAVIKPQFEKREAGFYIRYSDNQYDGFNDNLPDYAPDEIETAEGDTNYSYQEIKFKTIDRSVIISQLILSKYTYDDQAAILANRGDGKESHEVEHDNFQKFRRFCKLLADVFIEEYG